MIPRRASGSSFSTLRSGSSLDSLDLTIYNGAAHLGALHRVSRHGQHQFKLQLAADGSTSSVAHSRDDDSDDSFFAYTKRFAASAAVNGLSPGRDGSDIDMEPQGTQSRDCEPTPPLQRHGSKSNFFLPPMDGNGGMNMNGGQGGAQGGQNGGGDSPRQHIRMYHPRHSPHPRQRGLDPSRSFTPEGLSPDQQQPPPPMITIQQQQNQQGMPRGGNNSSATPTMQQRIKALGVATPLAMSSPVRRSNPGTPTQPRRPDFIGVNMMSPQQQQQIQQQQQQQQFHQTGLPPVHPYHQQQQSQQLQQQQQQYPMVHHNGGLPGQQQQQPGQVRPPSNVVVSAQRRYLSEGELARQGAELSYARSNQTVDNIRELAGSPQRGVYMWKNDTSPGFSNGVGVVNPQLSQGQSGPGPGVFVSMAQSAAAGVYQNQPSPTTAPQQSSSYGGVSAARYQLQQAQQSQTAAAGYHPALRGGVPVFPPQPPIVTTTTQSQSIGGPQAPSPQIKRKATPTRPMSFVRALEMTDSLEMNPTGQAQGGQDGSSQQGGAGGRATTPTPPDRASVYDMNYEISV
ncbi:hypothetical protein quinque_015535 [Culex quinquefasciatus]